MEPTHSCPAESDAGRAGLLPAPAQAWNDAFTDVAAVRDPVPRLVLDDDAGVIQAPSRPRSYGIIVP